ncbi:MAG: nucleotidyl transferase AbiEii/AbiGii toxin family protein, partial [Acinetobacter sp.]
MYLHENKLDWNELTARTAQRYQLDQAFVIKDYFIYLALKEITSINNAIVFKGGTSLSKCYNAISRFSEDVDLGIETEHATESQRKHIKAAVVEAVDRMGLKIANKEETRSRREFNKYILPLPSTGKEIQGVSIIIETAVMTPASPAVSKPVDSYIYRLCIEDGLTDIAEEYGLQPFFLMANSLERTFVDKVFALCDYYLSESIPPRQSRHIYDLYKLSTMITFNSELADLFRTVRKQRKNGYRCFSADEKINLSMTLIRISVEHPYRVDYEKLTVPLL